jgi:hypothetical protein
VRLSGLSARIYQARGGNLGNFMIRQATFDRHTPKEETRSLAGGCYRRTIAKCPAMENGWLFAETQVQSCTSRENPSLCAERKISWVRKYLLVMDEKQRRRRSINDLRWIEISPIRKFMADPGSHLPL